MFIIFMGFMFEKLGLTEIPKVISRTNGWAIPEKAWNVFMIPYILASTIEKMVALNQKLESEAVAGTAFPQPNQSLWLN